MTKWYDDPALVRELPARYRAYAFYSRLVGDRSSRRVRGGSLMLRLLRRASAAAHLSTVGRIRGINGLVAVADFGDERILDVIHEIRGENPEYRVMRALLAEGDTFVDVGANFGTFALLASRMVGATGKVVAIEPQPRLVEYIAEGIRLSGITNCEVKRATCGGVQTEATLMVPAHDAGRAGLFAAFSARGVHDAVSVYVSTLDSLLRDTDCPGKMLIKIDAEGSEFAVLEGARDTIASRRPHLLIEINPWSAAAAGKTIDGLMDLLESLGYRSFATVTSFPDSVPRSAIALDVQANVVAMP